jgi:hypothetical protein
MVGAFAVPTEWAVLFGMLCSSAVAGSLHELTSAQGTSRCLVVLNSLVKVVTETDYLAESLLKLISN